MSAVLRYDGMMAGLVRAEAWIFEGREYATPASEIEVCDTVGEALTDVSAAGVARARSFVFGQGASTYTAQALLAMAEAYELEVGDGSEGVDPVTAILRDAARRIAVVEALTV